MKKIALNLSPKNKKQQNEQHTNAIIKNPKISFCENLLLSITE